MPALTHPAALWALLGVPMVLAIHFLQRRSRRQVVTTLFLLQQAHRQSEQGQHFTRLRQSVPLWLQLLMVLILTWLLAEPRWSRPEAVHRLAVVLDSSASMQVCRQEAEAAVLRLLDRLVPAGARAELTLLTSDEKAASLYHGPAIGGLRQAMVQKWSPALGHHDFTAALRHARTMAGPLAAVVMVTDHAPETALPFGARALSVGSPVANVGWAGVRTEEKDGQWFWQAMVRNASDEPQSRQWHAEVEGQAAPAAALTLAARETRLLSGPFPETGRDEDGASLVLVLSGDRFAMDDRLPMVRPRPKTLALHLPSKNSAGLKDFFLLFDHTQPAASASEADVRVLSWPPTIALEPDQTACIFASPSRDASPPLLIGAIVAEPHPLMEGLNWQGLLAREGMVIPQQPQDEVLLWQGERPLVSLRESASRARQLFCHFDLAASNVRKLPAMAVLLHRFLEQVRRSAPGLEHANFETGQRLRPALLSASADILYQPEKEPVQTFPAHQATLIRAPAEPGFFKVEQEGRLLLRAAAHFADVRESDLSSASALDETAGLEAGTSESLTETDPRWRLWTLLFMALLLGSWAWSRENRSGSAPQPAASALT